MIVAVAFGVTLAMAAVGVLIPDPILAGTQFVTAALLGWHLRAERMTGNGPNQTGARGNRASQRVSDVDGGSLVN